MKLFDKVRIKYKNTQYVDCNVKSVKLTKEKPEKYLVIMFAQTVVEISYYIHYFSSFS